MYRIFMSKKTIFTVFAAILALTAGLLVQRTVSTSVEKEEVAKLLEFSFPDVSEQMQSISQWRGKVLVINFWATWCAPCLKEIPEFIKLQAEYQQQGLQFIGVAIEDKQSMSVYLQGNKINYPVLIAGDAGIGLAHQLGNIIDAVPFTVIVNREGQVVYRQPGELSVDKLLSVVTPLIAVK